MRGGQEHRFLCISQLQRLTNPDRYIYVENGSKNRSGGLGGTARNKIVPVFANPEAGERDHVYILDMYLSRIGSVIHSTFARKATGKLLQFGIQRHLWVETP